MHVLSFFPTNQIVFAIKRYILPKMFMRCSKEVSAITSTIKVSAIWGFFYESLIVIRLVS